MLMLNMNQCTLLQILPFAPAEDLAIHTVPSPLSLLEW